MLCLPRSMAQFLVICETAAFVMAYGTNPGRAISALTDDMFTIAAPSLPDFVIRGMTCFVISAVPRMLTAKDLSRAARVENTIQGAACCRGRRRMSHKLHQVNFKTFENKLQASIM